MTGDINRYIDYLFHDCDVFMIEKLKRMFDYEIDLIDTGDMMLHPYFVEKVNEETALFRNAASINELNNSMRVVDLFYHIASSLEWNLGGDMKEYISNLLTRFNKYFAISIGNLEDVIRLTLTDSDAEQTIFDAKNVYLCTYD